MSHRKSSPSRSRRFHNCSASAASQFIIFRKALRLSGFCDSVIFIERLQSDRRSWDQDGCPCGSSRDVPEQREVSQRRENFRVYVLYQREVDISLEATWNAIEDFREPLVLRIMIAIKVIKLITSFGQERLTFIPHTPAY